MFLHDIPPVGSQDGLKINPLLITEAQKKKQAWVLQFWQHLERFFFFFQRAQCERDEPFKEKKMQIYQLPFSTQKQINGNLTPPAPKFLCRT